MCGARALGRSARAELGGSVEHVHCALLVALFA
jgi:hypothetical protein